MNNGINEITKKYIDKITNYGNLPSKSVQTICKIDNKLDWRKAGSNGWSSIAESMFETIKKSNTFSYTNRFTAKAVFAGTSLAYVSGTIMADGRIILVPFNSTTSVIWDPNNDINTTPGGTYAGSGAFSSCVLLRNGEVLFIPRNAACRVYNPVTNTVRTIGSAPPANGYITGVLMQDGRVYCIPFNNTTTAIIIDPINNTVKNATGTYSNGGANLGYGGVLLPDGRIFVVSNNANSACWIYDPIKDVLSTTRQTVPQTYQGAILLPDERILILPSSTNGNLMIYDWNKDIFRLSKVIVPNTAGGLILLPDGTVMVTGLSLGSFLLYNPNTDTAITPPGTFTAAASTGGNLLFDGRLIFFPRSSSSLTGYGVNGLGFSSDVLLSAHYNCRR
jgi:WD40 repeat protein